MIHEVIQKDEGIDTWLFDDNHVRCSKIMIHDCNTSIRMSTY